jgi:hypothetical protein
MGKRSRSQLARVVDTNESTESTSALDWDSALHEEIVSTPQHRVMYKVRLMSVSEVGTVAQDREMNRS